MKRPSSWAGRWLRNVLLWIAPVGILWAFLTPSYNRFLLETAENLVHLFEAPDVTELAVHARSRHEGYIVRTDFPPVRSLVRQLRVTDLHFHLILLVCLFIAVPGERWRDRLWRLGQALILAVAFDVIALAVTVETTYATHLGPWSLAHYGPLARNLWGLAGHLVALPLKLALPLLLWSGFYLSRLQSAVVPEPVGRQGDRPRRSANAVRGAAAAVGSTSPDRSARRPPRGADRRSAE